jgi:hypothetical protein
VFAHSLRALSLEAVPWLTNDLFRAMHSVEELRIIRCHNLNADALTENALLNLPVTARLHYLHVDDSPIIGEDTLARITRHCTLVHLSLANLSTLSNRTLTGDFSHLQYLQLESFGVAAYSALTCQAFERMPKLHHVNLSFFDGCGYCQKDAIANASTSSTRRSDADRETSTDFQADWIRLFQSELVAENLPAGRVWPCLTKLSTDWGVVGTGFTVRVNVDHDVLYGDLNWEESQ